MNLNFLGIFQKFWPNLQLSAIWVILPFDHSAICTSAFNIFTQKDGLAALVQFLISRSDTKYKNGIVVFGRKKWAESS
jgi:hypothetical protein